VHLKGKIGGETDKRERERERERDIHTKIKDKRVKRTIMEIFM